MMIELLQLITAPQNLPFGIALMLMLLLFIFEILALLFGGIHDWLDSLLPEGLNSHAEIAVDPINSGLFIGILSWLYVGRVPILMLFILFLTIFGLLGFILQASIFQLLGFYLPLALATLIVWLLSLPLLRLSAMVLYKILPKDETTAIHQSELSDALARL